MSAESDRRYTDKQRRKGLKRMTLWVPVGDVKLATDWARKRRKLVLKNR